MPSAPFVVVGGNLRFEGVGEPRENGANFGIFGISNLLGAFSGSLSVSSQKHGAVIYDHRPTNSIFGNKQIHGYISA